MSESTFAWAQARGGGKVIVSWESAGMVFRDGETNAIIPDVPDDVRAEVDRAAEASISELAEMIREDRAAHPEDYEDDE